MQWLARAAPKGPVGLIGHRGAGHGSVAGPPVSARAFGAPLAPTLRVPADLSDPPGPFADPLLNIFKRGLIAPQSRELTLYGHARISSDKIFITSTQAVVHENLLSNFSSYAPGQRSFW
jgi:hypothetical protein